MTPIVLIFGQSNAAAFDNTGALKSAIEAQGGSAIEVGVHGGSQSAAMVNGQWNIIDDDGDDTGGSSYVRLLETMERTLAENPDSYIAGAVWVQGEQDSQTKLIGDYYDPVSTLFTQMRSDLDADFPISIIGPSDYQQTNDLGRAHIRETQQKLAEDLPDVYFVDTDAIIAENDLTVEEVMTDNLHYTADFFTYLADAVLEEPALRDSLGLDLENASVEVDPQSVQHAQASPLLFDLLPTIPLEEIAFVEEAEESPDIWDIF